MWGDRVGGGETNTSGLYWISGGLSNDDNGNDSKDNNESIYGNDSTDSYHINDGNEGINLAQRVIFIKICAKMRTHEA